jgi:hypothetical protein
MVFNISVRSWWSVLLGIGVPRENHRPSTGHWQTLSHNFVSSMPRLRVVYEYSNLKNNINKVVSNIKWMS